MLVAQVFTERGAGLQGVLSQYLEPLTQRLLALLQNGQKMVQEGALTAMASVADCAKTHFVNFYGQVGLLANTVAALNTSWQSLGGHRRSHMDAATCWLHACFDTRLSCIPSLAGLHSPQRF